METMASLVTVKRLGMAWDPTASSASRKNWMAVKGEETMATFVHAKGVEMTHDVVAYMVLADLAFSVLAAIDAIQIPRERKV